MPQCSVKNCKNHTSRTLKEYEVSFFRFPRDPVRCGEWTSVFARQRCEEFFKPSKSSIVCSKHFSKSDLYVTPKGVTRLHKTAIPQIDKDDDGEDKCFFDTKTTKSCILHQQDKDGQKDIIIMEKKTNEDCLLNPQINITSNVPEVIKSPSSSLSVGSILDTPKKRTLKKEIRACRRLITSKNKKINNLQKKNTRLKKKCRNLKNILTTLSKREAIDQSLLSDLSQYVEVTDVFNAMYLKKK